MPQPFEQVDRTIMHIASLAADLAADRDGQVRRSVEELRATFETRGPVEPAVTRVRQTLTTLRQTSTEGWRREPQPRGTGVEQLAQAVEQELLPSLRRLGFDL